eukprot:2352323-Pyramimonas_sp.AAC.1
MRSGRKSMRSGRKSMRSGRSSMRSGRNSMRSGCNSMRSGRNSMWSGRNSMRSGCKSMRSSHRFARVCALQAVGFTTRARGLAQSRTHTRLEIALNSFASCLCHRSLAPQIFRFDV